MIDDCVRGTHGRRRMAGRDQTTSRLLDHSGSTRAHALPFPSLLRVFELMYEEVVYKYLLGFLPYLLKGSAETLFTATER